MTWIQRKLRLNLKKSKNKKDEETKKWTTWKQEISFPLLPFSNTLSVRCMFPVFSQLFPSSLLFPVTHSPRLTCTHSLSSLLPPLPPPPPPPVLHSVRLKKRASTAHSKRQKMHQLIPARRPAPSANQRTAPREGVLSSKKERNEGGREEGWVGLW